MRRFKGTAIALAAVVILVLVTVVVGRRDQGSEVPEQPQPALFRFEKEDLVRILVERPDTTIELVREPDGWRVVGRPWKPSSSMVRRVGHQIHELTARAVVAEESDDLSVYGLGERAIRVTLGLESGQTIRFEAGDPNPTSVSYYVRPLPGEVVYIVQKAAVDYYRLDLESFRERRFCALDADEADSIEAEVDGRRLVLHRIGHRRWRMTEPADWQAATEEVRTMLGRTGALKVGAFVADQPSDLAPWGLAPWEHRVRIGLASGEAITLLVGAPVEGSDPPERYVYRVEDDAVYTARDGFLEAFRLPLEQYRRRDVLGLHEWDLAAMRVSRGVDELRITRTSDGWRWPDEARIPGSTPRRVAQRAAEAEALAFHDEPPAAAGLDSPYATVVLEVAEEGPERVVTVGAAVDEERRRFLAVDGDPVVYEVDAALSEVIDDLFREHARKVERDADKHYSDALPEREPSVPDEEPP